MGDEQTGEVQAERASFRRRLVRVVSYAIWASILVWLGLLVFRDPSPTNLITVAGMTGLFLIVNAQMLLVRWLGQRRFDRTMAKLHGSAYVSELEGLPNRNYLLAELRREMPRARANETPFVLIVLSLDTLAEIAQRRGPDFSDRAMRSLAQVLKRLTRTSDFVAHLDGPRFCVMLNECTRNQAFIYLQRVPGTVAVSDGRHMYEVPLSARVHEYDLENLYATDVLREAEEMRPLRRKEVQYFGSEAA
jgi:diguanylate cyclase (GGDEF)-like protein